MNRKQGRPKPVPLAKIAAALFETTEVLARELTVPSDGAPAWDDFQWRIARSAAAMQGVSQLLAAVLRWKGPESWRQFLEEQRRHIAERHRKISRLLDRIDYVARQEGIPFVALKGAALHALGVYEAGERPMADIDLLVRDIDVNAMLGLLEECDYEVTFITRRHHLLEHKLARGAKVGALGEHEDNPIKIELHTSIRERLPVSEIEITQMVFPISAHPGQNSYRSAASLMCHLLLHAAGNMRAHALRLVQLHDIARLATRLGSNDWKELATAQASGQGLWWAVAPLILTARYYPASVPVDIMSQLSPQCPWLLRKRCRKYRIADVSWSNIAIYAFPGIEWARNPREAFSYMLSRALPSRDTRSELERFATHPGVSTVPWYGISQGARVLRWAFSKPPRVQTLLSVRAALR